MNTKFDDNKFKYCTNIKFNLEIRDTSIHLCKLIKHPLYVLLYFIAKSLLRLK